MKLFIIACITVLLVLTNIVKASAADSAKKHIEVSVNLDPNTPLDKNQSYILIDSLPEYAVKIDENISIPVFVYRGITLKRTLYVWIQDKDNKRISSKSKFSMLNRFESYNFSANLAFSKCASGGTHTIVAQGLGINSTKQVSLDFIDCNQTTAKIDGKISFSVLSSVQAIESGRPFKTRLVMTNPTEQNLEVLSWSYVYRSSRCYSGEREQNKKSINLPEFSNVTFDLENIVEAPTGNYTLKILFLRSDRKTPSEIKLPITVRETQQNSSNQSEKNKDNNKLSITKDIDAEFSDGTNKSKPAEKRSLFSFLGPKNTSSGTVYESSSAKARNLIVYFLILALALMLIALILKKL